MNDRNQQRFELLIARYDEWLAAINRSVRTRETYQRGVRQFLAWLNAHTTITTLAAVTPAHIQQYQLSIFTAGNAQGQPLSVGAQQLRLTIVRQFFHWLVREQQLAFNPAANIVLPKTSQRLPATLTADEAQRLLSSLPTKQPRDLRDRAIVELLYSAGLRRAELLALTIYNVDLISSTLTVKQGKGNRSRVLPMVESTRQALNVYLSQARSKLASNGSGDLLFISSRSGGLLDGNDIKRIVAKAAKRAGINKPVTPHMLRHSLATHLLASNADIRHIQQILGHRKLSTTERYTQVAIGDLQAVIARCHPRAK